MYRRHCLQPPDNTISLTIFMSINRRKKSNKSYIQTWALIQITLFNIISGCTSLHFGSYSALKKELTSEVCGRRFTYTPS